MKERLVFVTAVALFAGAALAQLRIVSLDSSGVLAWTNSIYRGFYTVESAGSPTDAWQPLATVADLDWAKTNRMVVQVPLSNATGFYRVTWIPPNPTGLWDYWGYERGELVITGRLNLGMGNLLTTNPVAHRVGGSWNLGYVGPPTNAWQKYFWPLVGTGVLTGTLASDYAHLHLEWPTNCIDCTVTLSGMLGPNNCTGTWSHVTFGGPRGGIFNAVRTPSTNSVNTDSQIRRPAIWEQ